MSKLKCILVFGALFALALAENEPKNAQVPVNNADTSIKKDETTINPIPTTAKTTEAPPLTTSEAPSPIPPKPSPPTPPKTTSPPSPPPKTTTIPPDTTTTPAPKTTSVAPNTTTVAPTTAKPTPMPTPPPEVDPKTHTWAANFPNSNVSCVVAQMALQVKITYFVGDNKTQTTFVNVPENATANGVCSNITQTLTITWNGLNFVSLHLKNNTKSYGLDSIQVSIVPDARLFPGIAKNISDISLMHSIFEFNTTENMSYRCKKDQPLKLNVTDPKVVKEAVLIVSDLQLQAFRANTSKSGFSDPVDCYPLDTPDIVPIAAGCALAVLIIIVLLAYLLGRRRSQARGYLSM